MYARLHQSLLPDGAMEISIFTAIGSEDYPLFRVKLTDSSNDSIVSLGDLSNVDLALETSNNTTYLTSSDS